MQDREPTYPGRVTLTPVSGLANTYDMERADRPLQEGTLLNKASLLKDTTAALFGLGTDAVPDDALNLLSRFQAGLGNEYVWAKYNTGNFVGYVNSPDPNMYPPSISDGFTYSRLGQIADALNWEKRLVKIKENVNSERRSWWIVPLDDIDWGNYSKIHIELHPNQTSAFPAGTFRFFQSVSPTSSDQSMGGGSWPSISGDAISFFSTFDVQHNANRIPLFIAYDKSVYFTIAYDQIKSMVFTGQYYNVGLRVVIYGEL